MQPAWPRPTPVVGDQTSAADRAGDPTGWAFSRDEREAVLRVMAARRDIRRFRPDPVTEEVLKRVLSAAHAAPSVGHSQPWRFVVVADSEARAKAALLADRARLAQAAQMDPEAARQLLDLDLEGIREAPIGLVVCCDRRAPAPGVLGRATFVDADMWSCACAIENLWLAARAEGLGVGWVTLFKPEELAALVGAPATVATLGWLCLGWPDERPPAPGLERRGWSERVPLESLIFRERWPDTVAPPRSRLAVPAQSEVVAAHDTADRLLSPPGSLGVLDRAVDRLLALDVDSAMAGRGALVLVAADHPVAKYGVSAYHPAVTRTAAEAAARGVSVGAVAATSAGLHFIVVDAGIDGPPLDGARHLRPVDPRGDLATNDALSQRDAERLVAAGSDLARELISSGVRLLAMGEIGIGNTTVAAALGAALLRAEPGRLVGLGAGSDSAIVEAKRWVVAEAVARVRSKVDPLELLAALGGAEIAVLTGLTLGAAARRAVVVLDGMATSVAALVAVEAEPAVAAHLVAGQRSREEGHALVLQALGLEPVLDLRFRAGEGVGAAMAVNLLRAGLQIRLGSARTGAVTLSGE